MKTPVQKLRPGRLRAAGPRLQRILVPTDLSRPAAQALRYAVPLARQVGGKITLLHVLEWPVVPAEVGALMTDEARLTRGAEQAMADLANATVPRELLGRIVVRVGRSYEAIARAARDLKMDLIVQATHGRTGVRRVLLGSTAERVVRHAPCPVLTVPRRSAQPPPTGAPRGSPTGSIASWYPWTSRRRPRQRSATPQVWRASWKPGWRCCTCSSRCP
ncbi:MAG: universal stress protein [Verrucomicrobia bacterium]|nr:universal stress protein [Verrucomicrobiota bacterium]